MENSQQTIIKQVKQTIPQRSRFEFKQNRQPSIFFSSQFDSGNLSNVIKKTYDHYSLWTATDAQGTQNQGYPKSWFYFKVGGFNNRKVTFSIHRLHFLYAMCKRPQLYRPVYRIHTDNNQTSKWERLSYPIISLCINEQEQLVLKFDFFFNKLFTSVDFAFTYPYSYEECMNDFKKLEEDYQYDKQLLLRVYQLTKSYEKRSINMLMISSHEGKDGIQTIKNPIFNDKKIVRFRNNKPIIFVSARVHPIQTGSSYTMQGIIQFLLNKRDARAYLLRKYFVFVLVPMLNPDGVSRGHCRMDALNQNLNRYYTNPDPQKQQSCYAVKKLCEHYSKDKRLFMYLDLHAHPALKGNFTFGNAIYQFIQQVQSQLFSKVLSRNCVNFQFQQCIFSRKHMKAKDRNEDVSKQGCGRVVFYKQFGLIHSYTLQCGYHMNTYNNELQPQKNTTLKHLVRYKLNDKNEKIYENQQKIIENDKLQSVLQQLQYQENKGWDIYEYTSNYLDNNEDQYYKRQNVLYNIDTFLNLGRNIMISLLDIWNKNPYTRHNDIGQFRKEIAQKQSKLDRFRKQQMGIKTKQKKIVQLIQQQLYAQWHKRNIFNANTAVQNNRPKNKTQNIPFNKIHSLKHQKSQKQQKQFHLGKSQQQKPIFHSQNIIKIQQQTIKRISNASNINNLLADQKPLTISQTYVQNKSFMPKNFKLTRSKQITNLIQKDGNERLSSMNRQLLIGTFKIAPQQNTTTVLKQQTYHRQSKMIKSALGNLKIRNTTLQSNKK